MEKVNVKINGIDVQVPADATILEAANQVGVRIPTLCYLEGINEIGACRVCVVEIEGKSQLEASCNTAVEEGMVVYTNSHRVRKSRKAIVELILSQHDCLCATCVRSGNCEAHSVSCNFAKHF